MKRVTSKANLDASNELFAKLVDEAHKRGIRIIIDGVFNHCGSFNKWMDREGFYEANGYPPGAYSGVHSPYRDYFIWNTPTTYDSWWGHDNQPKLNFEGCPELYDYILRIAAKWVSPPYNMDGWRLDMAADLGTTEEFNHKFWTDFRTAVKDANPEAIILAEFYGDPKPWLSGGEWDTIMNYDAFMEPLTWFLTGVNKHSEQENGYLYNNAAAFVNTMRYNMAKLPFVSLQTAMNQLSNHDHSRFLTRTNRTTGRLHTKGSYAASVGIDKAVFIEALIFQMTWIGSPAVYYGDEAGVYGWTDPDNRKPYPWGKEDAELIKVHKELISVRKKFRCLSNGSTVFLFADGGTLAYGRFDDNEKIIVVINNGEQRDITVPVWLTGIKNGMGLVAQYATWQYTDLLKVKKDNIRITMPKKSGIILTKET
jgi:alpha-glucosidase